MRQPLDHTSIEQLFLAARSYNAWSEQEIEKNQVHQIYEILKFGPTSANGCPARFVWVRSAEGKQTLAKCAWEYNAPKILKAPLTVIVGYDLAFSELLPQLYPSRAEIYRKLFLGDPKFAQLSAFRNSSLQGAYLIIVARALGLDCGPMEGFDNEAVDEAFFAGTKIKSNFICSLGVGSNEGLFPRNPRLTFEQASTFV
jgi:3-hydroxypropanoate dehydrogenase